MVEMPFNSVKDIDLDKLRANHTRLYYFGLGFIQLKIDETYRLHFYSSEVPVITDEIHNHRYHFHSKVLQGELTNFWYTITDGDSHIMVNESCNAEIEAPKLDKPCHAFLNQIETYRAGDMYYLSEEAFHRVNTSSNCITLLKRSDYTKQFAQIVLPVGHNSICPFSKQIPKDELWEMIKRML
jgi:hypothetical protein